MSVLAWALVGCAARPAQSYRAMDTAEWGEVRDALDAERASLPARSWSAAIAVTMREPKSGQAIDGRGAIAVAPSRAVRLVLVGPAGTTALDAWVTPARWRIAVPPADVVRRGAADEPDDLPVGFLRWTFFRRLEGTLFEGWLRPERVFFLRDGDAVIEVREGRCDRGRRTVTTRRAHGRTERIEECRAASAVSAGDWVRYADEASGLQVELTFESRSPSPPDEGAFVDPEAEAR